MIRLLFLSCVAVALGAAPADAGALGALAKVGALIKGSVVLKAVAQITLSYGVNLLAQKLRGKPKEPGVQNSFKGRGATQPATSVLGRAATKGHWVYHNSFDYNNHRYFEVIELGDLAGATLERIVIDGEYTAIGALNQDWGYEILAKDRQGASQPHRAWFLFYDGSQTAADPQLSAGFGGHPDRPWTAAHILKNRPYIKLAYEWDRKVFPRGVPECTFEMLGPPMYDPRLDSSVGGVGPQRWADTSTWSQTENPIILIYNIMRGIALPGGAIWGGDCEAEDLPLSNWVAAMNACDVPVNGRPKYRAGIEVNFTEPPKEAVEELMAACAAQIVELGGIWRIQVDAPATAAVTVTDADMSVSHAAAKEPFPGLEATYNGVTVTHPDPEMLWNGRPAETIRNAVWEARDGTRRLFDLKLPAVPYPEQARQLANMMLKDNRRFRRHQRVLPPDYFHLNALETLSWYSEEEAYSGALFELAEVAYDLRSFNVHLSMRERDLSDWVPDLSLEIGTPPPPTAVLPRVDDGVPNFAMVGITIDDANGPRRPAFSLTWDGDLLSRTSTSLAYELRVLTTQITVDSGSTANLEDGELVLSGDLLPGETYQARVKALSLYREADWSSWLTAVAPAVSDQVRIVSVYAAAQAFEYDAGGQNPSPASTTITATAQNTIGVPFYEFLIDGVSVQNSAIATFAYTPPASIVDMPQLIAVRLREDSPTNPVLAVDQQTTFGLQAGGTTLTGHLSNQTHTLAADPDGSNPQMTGSGTMIEVYFGSSRLTYNGVGTSPGTYAVTATVHAGAISPGTLTAVGGNARAADHAGMTTDVAIIRFAISGQDTAGTPFGMTLDQSVSKVKAGVSGADGDDGDDGSDGVSPLTVHLDNPATQVLATSSGSVVSYIGSGCTIEVFQGTTALQFTTSSNLQPGFWRIFDTDVFPGTNDIAVGTIIDSGHEATVNAHSAMNSTTDVVTIGYDIQARSLDGTLQTLTVKQTVSKSKQGTPGLQGLDGNDGSNGVSVAFLKVYRRSANAVSTPNGGSFNFTTRVLSAPSFWSRTVPSGTAPLYSSVATASIIGASGVDNTLTWSSPVIESQNGNDGASGKSTFQAAAFRRFTTQPATPSGGSFNFTSNVFTPPSGWSATEPAGSDPCYVTRYLFAITGDTGTATGGSWSTPVKLVEDGADGSDGLSTYLVTVQRRQSYQPTTPTGGNYNFTTNTLTPPSGWSDGPPPAGSNPIWVSAALASVQGPIGSDYTLSWSTPTKYIENGAPGAPGAPGNNGTDGDSKITGTVYYQNLQLATPSSPNAFDYNVATGQFIGLSAGWGTTQPAIDATDTSKREWRSDYIVTIPPTGPKTISFTTPNGAIQFASDIQSDNFDGNPNGTNLGTQGWSASRDLGVLITSALYIRDKLVASQIDLDGNVITGGPNGITITTNGITTPLLANDAASMPMGSSVGTLLSGSGAGGGYQLATQITANVTDVQEVELKWNFEQAYASGDGPNWGFRLRRGGTTIKFRTNMFFGVDYPGGVFVDATPGSGNQTYYLDWWSTNDSSLTARGYLSIGGRKV